MSEYGFSLTRIFPYNDRMSLYLTSSYEFVLINSLYLQYGNMRVREIPYSSTFGTKYSKMDEVKFVEDSL